ncbi:hypothetical protein BB431_07945 [Helicobacter pylori]|nr:hypothetical protein BB431_07945 [Helicobacter pylori]
MVQEILSVKNSHSFFENFQLNKALELCKQSGLVLRAFDGKNFSFKCGETNRSNNPNEKIDP